MEEGDAQISLKSADLTGDGRLAHMELVAGVGEAAGISSRMEDEKFVPIHIILHREQHLAPLGSVPKTKTLACYAYGSRQTCKI